LVMFKCDNARDIVMQYHFPYLPWRRGTDRIISMFCHAALGGQGKYNSDRRVSLLRVTVAGVIAQTFANGDMP
jgi:hypothetical protein